MTSDKGKSNPIPTRFDDDITEMIDRLNAATGLSRAEIIRRAVRFALGRAQQTGSVNFLFGDESVIRDALNPSRESVESNRVTYDDQPSPVALVSEGDPAEPAAPAAKTSDSAPLQRPILDAINRNANAVKTEKLRRELDAHATDPTAEDRPQPQASNGEPLDV